jgi:hypothetical protein
MTRELCVSFRVSAIGFAGTARPAVMPENLVDPFFDLQRMSTLMRVFPLSL